MPSHRHWHSGLPDLYRRARTLDGDAFAREVFNWLGRHIAFDAATLVTSFPDRPTYVDAHFHNLPDPAAILASWSQVQHLDVLSPLLLTQPLRAQRQDIDDRRIAGPMHAPLREHLQRFRLNRSLCIAAPTDTGLAMSVLILVRHDAAQRFQGSDLRRLEMLAPHVAESAAVCRDLALLRNPQIGVVEMPVAKIDASGQFIQSTPAFARLFWNAATPQTARLDDDCLAVLRRGKAWPLADGRHMLHALPEDAGWLLRLRPASYIERLSTRERELAFRFAAGENHKEIARAVGLSPATVRNHLRNIYAKLGIQHRVGLIAALGESRV